MKKMIGILLALCVAAGLTACNRDGISENEIASAKLTAEQQEIVDLLTNDKQEILLFDYRTKETYNRMEVWVEVYQDGILIDRPTDISTGNDEAYQHKGRLAIDISQNPDFQWAITIDNTVTRSTHRSTDTPGAAIDPALARVYGTMTGGAVIESGK